jgi:hypothetical protein
MTPRLSTSSTAPAWTPASGPSLYELLAEPVGTAVSSGETSLTATKETLDGDSEEASDGEVIYGRGG